MSARRGAPAARVALALACLTAAGGAAACDPCAGVPTCRTGERVSYTGRVIDYETGRGAAGVTVVFRRTGGPELAADSIVAQTDDEGRFRLDADARAHGTVAGEVTLRPPAPLPAYTIAGVSLATTDVRGASGVLETWTSQPYVSWVGSVVMRRGAGADWAWVRFRRTGGARLARGDTMTIPLDASAFFFIEALALDTGTVVGDLELYAGGLSRSYTIAGVRIPVRVRDVPPRLDRVLRVGSSLEYVLELWQRGTRAPVAGAQVTFRRKRGLRLVGDSVVGTTGTDGRVRLDPIPASDSTGEVVGEVVVRGGGLRTPYTIPEVRLSTFDSDELRFAGVYPVGYAAQVAGDAWFRGDRTQLANAEVRFVPTGGTAARTPSVTARTGADGWFGLAVPTDTAGEVVGDLIVQRPDAATPTTFRGVRLRAAGDDSVRYAGRYAVGAQFGYAGVLVDRATGTPAEGWKVTFRRTGGIALVSDSITSTVLDWGGFDLRPPTRSEGTVEGTLSARSPSGDRVVPLGSVKLTTWDSDSVQLAGRWAVGPSLLYVGELLREDSGAPIVGARAEFRRTGGIPTMESVVGEPSNQFGRFRMAPTPLASGEVVGDLYVFPPAPLRDTVFRDVRLQTFESDETRLRAVWRLAPPR